MDYQISLIVVGLVILAYSMFMPRRRQDFNLMGSQEKRIERALAHLAKKKRIDNRAYRKLTRVSQSQATEDFNVMEKEGLVEQINKGRHTFYQRKR